MGTDVAIFSQEMVFINLKFGRGRGGKQPNNVDDSERPQ